MTTTSSSPVLEPVPAPTAGRAFAWRDPSAWTWVLAWLALPIVVFAATWMRPAIGWPLAAAWGACAWLVRRQPVRGAAVEAALGIAVAAVLLAVFGFVGGVYNPDWMKHWAMLRVIGESDWPAHHAFADGDLDVRFYLGAYIAPALLRHAGVPLVVATALGFGAGFALLVGGFMRADPESPPGRRVAGALLALLVCGGDAIADAVARLATDRPLLLGERHVGWWYAQYGEHSLQFPSIFTGLAWAPHQTIGTGLVALVWATLPPRGGLRVPLLAYGALSLWSPFGMVGVLPLVLHGLWTQRREAVRDPLTVFTAALAAGTVLIVASFLVSDPLKMGLTPATIVEHLGKWPVALPFLVVSLGPSALILRERLWRDPVLLTCLVTLCLIPGLEAPTPDPALRASVGPLVVLYAAAGREAARRFAGGDWRVPLLALALCVPTIVTEVRLLVTHGRAYALLPPNDPVGDWYLRKFTASEGMTIEQALDETSWEFRQYYFTRKPPAILREPAHRQAATASAPGPAGSAARAAPAASAASTGAMFAPG